MRELREGDHLDQYLLTDLLARTPTATTFKGHDTEIGAPVCLKIPHLEYESDVVFYERFTREESIGLRMRHPNIVRALEPRAKSRMYLVTEFVEGRSLRALLQDGAISHDAALNMTDQLLDALVYLHEHGVVHRDLKPENVIVTVAGDAKLIDFGIARDRSASRLTWTGLSGRFGTPDYMAPERIAGRRGDERCDVYAAGVIMYEMLTGQLPFSDTNGHAVMNAKLQDEPKPPGYHLPALDPAIDAIVCRAIARDMRRRYQSARDFLDRLRRRDASDARVDESEVGGQGRRRPWVARLALLSVLAGLSSLVWLSR
jgi:serine/threonine-protein kinase